MPSASSPASPPWLASRRLAPVPAAVAGPADGVRPVEVPRAARAVDTSNPDRWVGNGTPGELHVARRRPRGREGRRDRASAADRTR